MFHSARRTFKIVLTSCCLLLLFGISKASPPPIPNATLPVTPANVTICYGDSIDVTVGFSEIGVSYQLVDSFSQALLGDTVMGTGGNIVLPSGPLYTNTIFQVLATDTSDASTAVLLNFVDVTVRPGISGVIYADSIPACMGTPIDFSVEDWAIDVNGFPEYVVVPTSPAINLTNEITVEAWINADTWTANRQEGVVVSNFNFSGAVGHEGFEIRVGDNGIVNFEVGINGSFLSYEAFSGNVMNTGTWYHIAGTYDGNFVRVYLNGVLQATTPIVGTMATSPLDLHLGKQAQFPVGRFFDGQIDEVRIWNYAKTDVELQSRMNQILGGNEPGLVAYYQMKQGPVNNTVLDFTPNGNNGTFTNMDPFADWSPTGPLLVPLTSYNWDFGDANGATTNNPTHSYAAAGNYNASVNLTDGFGCMNTPTAVIPITNGPVISLGNDTSLCGVASIVLDAGPGLTTYAWSTGATSQTITVAVADTYFVDVTNAQGCAGSDTIVVLGGSNIAVVLGADTTLCAGASLTLDAGNAGASFNWSTGDTTQTLTVSTAGQFSVIVSDSNGCTGTDTLITSISPAPGPFLPVDTAFCAGDSVTLSSAVTAVNYNWSTGALTPSVSILAPGQYILDIQDGNGCTWSDTTQVAQNPLPNVVFTAPALDYCFGDPVVGLQAVPAGGVFTGSGVTGTVFDPTAVPAPDTVSLLYTFTDSLGCTNADSHQVIIRALPVTFFTGLAASYCANDPAVTLTPNPIGGLFSGPGISANDFIPDSAGPGIHTISYLFTDGFGCTGQSDQTVEVFPLPVVSLTTPFTVLCSNSPAVNLVPVPAGGLLTGNGLAGTSFDPATAGLGQHPISYTYTDGNGCVNKDSLVMEASLAGLAPAYCENEPIATLTGAPAGGIFSGPGTNGSAFDPGSAGVGGPYETIYTYSVSANCMDADTQLVSVNAVPVVSITPIDPEYCSSAGPVGLAGQPAGGNFTGVGVAGTSFDPPAVPTGQLISILYDFTSPQGCTGTDSLQTQVYTDPGAALAGPDQDLYFTNSTTLMGVAPPIGTGTWEVINGSGNLVTPTSATSGLINLAEGMTVLRWTIENGPCRASDDIVLNVIPYDPVRGFSPNGDGLNETFEIPGLAAFPNSKLQVFDKLGNVLVASEDYQNDWEGLNGKGQQLPEDTYYYTLEVSNGTRVKGLVLLKR